MILSELQRNDTIHKTYHRNIRHHNTHLYVVNPDLRNLGPNTSIIDLTEMQYNCVCADKLYKLDREEYDSLKCTQLDLYFVCCVLSFGHGGQYPTKHLIVGGTLS